MNPDHLRAAIEKIGIEKPSDYTLVLEEVGRMEAEERLRLHGELTLQLQELCEEFNCPGGMNRVKFITHKMRKGREAEERLSALLTASEAFIKEAEEMGWGKTSDKALPGSFDLLLKAVREVKG